MKKKLLAGLIALALLCAVPVWATQDAALESLPEGMDVFLEEHPLDLPAYVVDGLVYTPVKTFVAYFGFSVSYDEETRQVILAYGNTEEEDYEAQFLDFVRDIGRTPVPSTHSFIYDNTPHDIGMVLIDSYNFAPLQTLSAFFGYHIVYNEESNTITISKDPLGGSSAEKLARYETYLAQHMQAINFEAAAPFKDSGFEAYNVYFIGESHAVADNYEVQLYFIKYLHEQFGLRYVIREMGYCDARLENEYIQTGDDTRLRAMLARYDGTLFSNKSQWEFYEKLYAYNQTLPAEERLILIGIDVQHNQETGLQYLLDLLEKYGNHSLIQEDITVIDGISGEKAFQTLCEKVRGNEDAYRAVMGEDYDDYLYSLRSLEQSLAHIVSGGDLELREQFIHENFTTFYEAYEVDRCFGMLGSMHVNFTASFGQTANLAQYLQSTYGPTKGKVAAIVMDYFQCEYMDTATGEAAPLQSTHSKILSQMMAEATEGKAALLRMDHEDSVLLEDGFTLGFQYFISLRNSPAAKPFV